MKKIPIIIISISIIIICVMLLKGRTEAWAVTIPNGKPYHIIFFKYNNNNMMLPIKKSNEKFDYTIGIDDNRDGIVDKEYIPNEETKQIAKPKKIKSSNFDVYIDGEKIKSPVKLFQDTDIYNETENRKLSNKEVQLEDLNSILILSAEGEVSPIDISSKMTYGSFGWALPVTINQYGQLASSSWLIPSVPSKSIKNFLDENGYEKMTVDFTLDEELVDMWNNIFDPRRLEVYIPSYYLDSTLYQLPKVGTDIGATLDTKGFMVNHDGIDEEVDYIKLSDIIYINPLCGHLDDVEYTETACSENHVKDLVKFKWTVAYDIWMEEFSGRLYLNGDEQPTVLGKDKASLELIDQGASDASDKLKRLSDYGLTDAFPLNTELLSVLLKEDTLKDPIIVMDHNFGNIDSTEYGAGVRINANEIGDDSSGKPISRGYSSKSKYIFQREKLGYSEKKNIENGVSISGGATTSCPTGVAEDCVFLFESEGEDLTPVKEHYGDRFDMYASDFVLADNEVPESKEIKTCRDLESIGRGENYPGASHYEAWSFDDNYILTQDINCYETTKKGSIYDDNPKDGLADGFEPVGYNMTGDGTVSPYTGTFDGAGYTISNLHMEHDYTNVGLFGVIGSGGVVKNINFVNSSISISSSTKGSAYAGTVAGENYGEVSNISIDSLGNTLVSNDSSISFTNGNSYSNIATGGIVGYNYGGKVLNSHAVGNVQTVNLTGDLTGSNIGGIVGYNSGQVKNTYAKGVVKGGNNVGGIVGYNYSTITDSLVNGYLENSYTMSIIEGKENIGGIVGANVKNAIVNNCYATSTFKRGKYKTGYVKGEKNVGGVAGTTSGKIKNVYGAVPVDGKENVGGVAGINNGDVRNSFSVGNIAGNDGEAGGIIGENANIGTTYNNYGYGIQMISNLTGDSNHVNNSTLIGDDKGSSSENKIASDLNLSSEEWFRNTTPGEGLTWKSSADKNATNLDWTAPVTAKSTTCLPWVYNDSNLDGTATGNDGTYVPGQDENCFKVLRVPNDVEVSNYKINASTNDIILNYVPTDPKNEILTASGSSYVNLDGFSIKKVGESTPLVCSPKVDIVTDPSSITTEDRLITFEGSKCNIESEEKYSIDIKGGTVVGQEIIREDFNIVLQMPKTKHSLGDNTIIGDGMNSNTFISSSTGYVDTALVTPTSTFDKFGIYELESIGYEEVNKEGSSSKEPANWSDSDLTLTKYDHVIRSLNDNYLIGGNIDASASKAKTDADKLGGFEADGYRPIGQMIGTVDGMDSQAFTGQITGNVDEICGASSCTDAAGNIIDYSSVENTYISNMYINTPKLNNIGLISIGNEAIISNLGIIDPDVEGNSNVGAFVGKMVYDGSGSVKSTSGKSGILLNLYVLESIDDSASVVYDVKGNGNSIGGIVGYSKNVEVYSDDRFSKAIPGIDNKLLTGQPSEVYPDRDGYKTFSTIDVINQNTTSDTIGGVGGIIGRAEYNANIANVYAKGSIFSNTNRVGGIVGRISSFYTYTDPTLVNVYNTYFEGNVEANSYVGGIVGSTDTNILNEALEPRMVIRNSYSLGNMSGNIGVGGIVGYMTGSGTIQNTYSKTNLLAEERVGGITNLNNDSTFKINNNYYIGEITATTLLNPPYVGGISGTSPYKAGSNPDVMLELQNNYVNATLNTQSTEVTSIGSMIGEGTTRVSGDAEAVIQNNYYYDTVWNLSGVEQATLPIDEEFETDLGSKTDKPANVNLVDINSVDWWINNLKFDSNWNIKEADASNPSSDIDTSDESQDDNLGRVNRGYYPTVKESNRASSVSDYEVPEQSSISTPEAKYDISVNNYKINAQTLDIYLNITAKAKVKGSIAGAINVYEGNYSSPATLPSVINYPLTYTIGTGDNIVTIPGTSTTYDIKADQDYTINILDTEGIEVERLVIHTPKQVVYDGKTYSIIGDNINISTDVEDAVIGDKIEPGNGSNLVSGTKTTANYGIYELESIGYEEANASGSTVSTSKADWSESDLTIAKYDHVIRPADGNYLIASNIDGSATDESTPTLDKDGGWSTDGKVNDGYRPIGQVIGTIDGVDSQSFTGEITGNVDEICGPSSCTSASGTAIDYSSVENTYISNMYISESTLSNVGMIGKGDDIHINNLGMIDPYIEGAKYVGSFVGDVEDSDTTVGDGNVIENVYGLDTSKTGKTDRIVGSEMVGGLIGRSLDTEVISSSKFTGSIPGVEDSFFGSQPLNNEPDRDGYKTFNTLNVNGGSYPSGIIGYTVNTNIDRVYNKGDIKGERYVGGIVGLLYDKATIKNAYNVGTITATGGTSLAAGGICAVCSGNGEQSIENVYNIGEVSAKTSSQAGGIAGYSDSDIKNAINVGDVTANYSVGGILGTVDNDGPLSNIQNVINIGNITALGKSSTSEVVPNASFVGGIIGNQEDGSPGSITLKNTLNVGDVTAKDIGSSYIGAILGYELKGTINLENNYYLESIAIIPSDGITSGYLPEEISPVGLGIISKTTWWKETLFENNPTNYDNFNIDVGDAKMPTPDNDSIDESQDDDLGQVNRGYYPTVKETDGTSALDSEIPEQSSNSMETGTEITIDNYKIDALSLDITLHYDVPSSSSDFVSKTVDEKEKIMQRYASSINLEKNNSFSRTALTCTPVVSVPHSTITFKNNGKECTIEQDTEYTISALGGESYIDPDSGEIFIHNDPLTLTIHTPKQKTLDFDANGDGVISDDEKGITYALIGDSVNKNTYVDSNISDLSGGNATPPSPAISTSKDKYGVYELESIGYEEKLLKDDTIQYDDWSENSLTLSKYNHIVRPLDGNYMQADDIDASGTHETTPLLDKDGGWTPDIDKDGVIDTSDGEISDGFAPVGGTTYGVDKCTLTVDYQCDEKYSFSGKYIVDETKNPVIKDMYINITNATGNIGIFANVSGVINGIETTVSDASKYFISGELSEDSWSEYTITEDDVISGVEYNVERDYNIGGVVGLLERGGLIINTKSASSVNGVSRAYYITDGTNNSGQPLSPPAFRLTDRANIGGIAGSSKQGGNFTNCEAKEGLIISSTLEKAPYSGKFNVEGGTGMGYNNQYLHGATLGGIVGVGDNIIIENSVSNADIEGGNTLDVPEFASGERSKMKNYRVGGVAGFYRGRMINTHSTGDVIGSGNDIGGVIGVAESGSLYDTLYSTGNVTGSGENVGGLVGRMSATKLKNSYSTGNIEGTYAVGGLIGMISGGVNVDNSYHSSGNVKGEDSVGGLIGANFQMDIKPNIVNSYATSYVEGNNGVGGLVGFATGGGITNSYATGNVKGENSIGGLAGVGTTTTNSYATGNVEGNYTVGGLVGSLSGDVINSYAIGDVVASGGKIGGLVGSVNNLDKDNVERNIYSIINSLALGDVAGKNFCKTSGESYDCGVGGLVGNHGVYDSPESIAAGVTGTQKIINSYVYTNQTITDIGSDGIAGTSDDISKPVSSSMVAGDDLTNDGTGSSVAPFMPNLVSASDLATNSWWTNSSPEGSGIAFNNYDVDKNGDIGDDKFHWDLSMVTESGTPLPKLNQVVGDSYDTLGDKYTSVGTPGQVPDQVDKFINSKKIYKIIHAELEYILNIGKS